MVDFLKKWRNAVILVVLAAVLVSVPPVPERWGDRIAWTLPALAGVCSIANGTWPETLLRFAAMEATVQGTKSALADAEINARPRGGERGFPSAHSAHAAFGASALVHDCVAGNPAMRAGLIVAAGFTGASRVDAGAHNAWQVLAGWIVGFGFERLWRHRRRRREA
jgi:membrane-associated phospholipid phosphatase